MSVIESHMPEEPERQSLLSAVLHTLFDISQRLTRLETQMADLKETVERQRIKASTVATSVAALVAVLLSMCGAGWAMYNALRAEIRDLGVELRAADSELRAEIREFGVELRAADAGLRAEIRELGVELRTEIRELGVELRAEIRAMDSGLRHELQLTRSEFNEAMRQLDDRVDRLDVRVAIAEDRAGLVPTSSSANVAGRTDIETRLELQHARLANIQLRLDILQGLLSQTPPPPDDLEAERLAAETPHDEANLWVDQLLARVGSVEVVLTR